MKQFLLMIMVTLGGSAAALIEPFWGVLMYYTFAVLRPQYMWKWAFPIELRWSLFAAIVVVGSVLLNLSKTFSRARLNVPGALMIAYGMLLILSMLTAHDTATAQHWAIEYAKVILMAFMAMLVIQHLWQVRLIAVMMMLMLGYIAWEMNSLYFFNGRLDIFHNGYGDLDNNGAGLTMAMGMPIAYAFGVSALRSWQRWGSWFLGVLMLHTLLMSYSRGAMLAAVIGAIYLLINHTPRIQSALIALVLSAAVSVLAGQEIRERFLSIQNYETDYSAQLRLASWNAAWELIWQRPLIGQGIRSSSQFIFNYGADQQGRTIHNQFLQIAADSGIPAAMVYFAMLLIALLYLQNCRSMSRRYLLNHLRPRSPDSWNHPYVLIDQINRLSLGFQASLVTFLVGGIFLSLELIEITWLLVTLAGTMPYLLYQRLVQLHQSTGDRPAPASTRPALGLATPLPRLVPTATY